MRTVERPWGVSAHGTASVRAEPDLARARFKVSRIEGEPSAAFTAAGEAVRAVRQALRAHGVPDEAVAQSRVDLRSSWSFEPERTFVGYQCEASFSVESRDLADLQPLLVDLVAAGVNEIEGVEFDVAAKDDLRARARREAVEDARGKAELYAEAAGVRLGAVVHIADDDQEQPYQAHDLSSGASSADFAPGYVTVSASVVVGFSIAHG